MRIIFLNSWFGKVGEPYFNFIKKEFRKTDIFCFMEYTPSLFHKVSKILKNWQCFIEVGRVLDIINDTDCQVIFAKKKFEIIDTGKFKLYKNDPHDTGFASFITFKFSRKDILLVNIHGKAHPGEKTDIPERIKQSQKIINFARKHDGPVIIGGDFNLNPDTKSIKMFEDAGYRNLIKDFGIKNTRNKISWERFNDKQYFADYCFVSSEIKVIKFKVPYLEISDHLPQILEFEI